MSVLATRGRRKARCQEDPFGLFLPVPQDDAWRQDKYSVNNPPEAAIWVRQAPMAGASLSFFDFFFFKTSNEREEC